MSEGPVTPERAQMLLAVGREMNLAAWALAALAVRRLHAERLDGAEEGKPLKPVGITMSVGPIPVEFGETLRDSLLEWDRTNLAPMGVRLTAETSTVLQALPKVDAPARLGQAAAAAGVGLTVRLECPRGADPVEPASNGAILKL